MRGDVREVPPVNRLAEQGSELEEDGRLVVFFCFFASSSRFFFCAARYSGGLMNDSM